jgi:predicted HTH domain antitoxin
MELTVQLPDRAAQQLTWPSGDIPRRVLEAVAIEGYRSELLSRGQVSDMLGLNFWQTEAFFKAHGANLHYSKEDLEEDSRANERVLSK